MNFISNDVLPSTRIKVSKPNDGFAKVLFDAINEIPSKGPEFEFLGLVKGLRRRFEHGFDEGGT